MSKKKISLYLNKFSERKNILESNKTIFYLDEVSKILIIEFKEDISFLKNEFNKRFKKKCIFNNKYILIYDFINTESNFFFLNFYFFDILEFDLTTNREVINDSGYSLFNSGKIKLEEQNIYFNLVNKKGYIYESDLKFLSILNDVFLTSEYLITKFNEKFILEVYNLLEIEVDFLEDYTDYEYSACAYKFLMKIYILKNLDYENMLYIVLHEIGHFYYWKYNKIKINSNDFLKDIKNNYISLQKKYKDCTYYFKFDISEKYKWNKKEEYFSEIFSLYCNNLLYEEDKLIFEKYICLNN